MCVSVVCIVCVRERCVCISVVYVVYDFLVGLN